MRYDLLCCTDTHGEAPAPNPRGEPAALAWLHAGDVYDGWRRQRGENLSPEVVDWYASRPVPVYAVRGNHDIRDDRGIIARCDDVTGSVRQVAPSLFVAGVGWHGEHFAELPLERELAEVCHAVERQVTRILGRGDRLSVLAHYPPELPELHDPGDEPPRGYACVRRLIEHLRPVAVVHGHEHDWFMTSGTIRLGDSDVLLLNPGPGGALLSVDVETGRAQHAWLSL